MATKEKLLQLLQTHPGTYFSGEEMALALGVSRTSVWKAVKALRESGYAIDAVTNRGYCLSPGEDPLDIGQISADLSGDFWTLHSEDRVPSTNALLRQLADQGAAEGTVILANAQTEGRGRMGRQFYSPGDTGIYLSLLLRPRDFSPDQALQLTTMAAAAACTAIEEVTGIRPGIKWVNDLLLDEKKICGILTEAAFNLETVSLDYAVAGLGLTLYAPRDGFPPELADIAAPLLPSPVPGTRNRLISAFLNRFGDLYRSRSFSQAAEVYRSRCLVLGKTVIQNSVPLQVLDVNDRCQLVVRDPEGQIRTLSYGEVSIVNQ